MYRVVGKFPWDGKTKAYSKVIRDKDEAIYIREALKKIVGKKSHFRIIPDSEVKLRIDIEDKWYD